MAGFLGVTFQQVQKYENGANRIAVATLVKAADALETPLSFFLEGLGPAAMGSARTNYKAYRHISIDGLEKVNDRKLRAAVRTVVRALMPQED